MAQWNQLKLTVPPEIASLGQTIGQGLDALKTGIEALKVLLQAVLAFEQDPTQTTVQATNAAVQALLSGINDAIDALLDDAGIYVLPIPLPKKGFARVLASVNPDESGSNYLQFPASALVGGLSAPEKRRLQASPLWQQILDADDTFLGGNAYFVQTLAESISDANDPGRPKFERTDSWAYALLVAGASDVTSLGSILTFLDRSFASRSSTGTARGTVSIVPSNPRVSLSGRELHAVIEWDSVTVSRLLASYDSSTLVATEFAIIRSTNFRAKTCVHVSELLGTASLREGATGQYGSRVVHVQPYDAVTSRWEDPAELDPALTYYYHVAFKGQLRGPDTVPALRVSDVAYGPLSRCMEIRRTVRRAASRTRGAPPDWIRTPSLATLFPPIESFLDNVKEQLNGLASASSNFSDRNDEYVAFLTAEVTKFTTKATEVQNQITAITDALSPPNGGASLSAKINTGTGPLAQFLAAVVQDFSDQSDAGRPAFDTGDEFVVGVVILAVGPDPARVQKALALFQAIFGSSEDDPVVAGVRSITQATNTVTADVDAQVRAVQAQIDAASSPPIDPTCTPAPLPPPPQFDDAMNPIEE